MLLATQIGNLKLDTCIYNASGPLCTTVKELVNLNKSNAACVLSKSATLEKREGNPKPRYFDHTLGSINSMGLPNQGYEYYLECASIISKPFLISVNGLTLDDTKVIVRKILENGKIQGMEINLSCPNIIGKGQLAYDLLEMENYLTEVFNVISEFPEHKLIIGVKLPPYFDLHWYPLITNILKKFAINFITCINSLGNGLLVDLETETTRIRPKNGMGGIGGIYVKPVGLSNVRNFYLEFQKQNLDIDIIGCGGITCGEDAMEYILCGASAVQIGTQLYQEGIEVFSRIEKEMLVWLEKKKYKSLLDFQGKLKTI